MRGTQKRFIPIFGISLLFVSTCLSSIQAEDTPQKTPQQVLEDYQKHGYFAKDDLPDNPKLNVVPHIGASVVANPQHDAKEIEAGVPARGLTDTVLVKAGLGVRYDISDRWPYGDSQDAELVFPFSVGMNSRELYWQFLLGLRMKFPVGRTGLRFITLEASQGIIIDYLCGDFRTTQVEGAKNFERLHFGYNLAILVGPEFQLSPHVSMSLYSGLSLVPFGFSDSHWKSDLTLLRYVPMAVDVGASLVFGPF